VFVLISSPRFPHFCREQMYLKPIFRRDLTLRAVWSVTFGWLVGATSFEECPHPASRLSITQCAIVHVHVYKLGSVLWEGKFVSCILVSIRTSCCRLIRFGFIILNYFIFIAEFLATAPDARVRFPALLDLLIVALE
jgi:hypothetical protein